MPLIQPKAEYLHWWEHWVTANAGKNRYEVMLYTDSSAEIVLESSITSSTTYYYLHGNFQKLSNNYGHIFVQNIRRSHGSLSSECNDLNIEDFEDSILFEYFHLPSSPYIQHPMDMLNVSAVWQSEFDALLILHPYTAGTVEGLRFMFNEPSDDYAVPDAKAVQEVAEILYMLDKCKFKVVEDHND